MQNRFTLSCLLGIAALAASCASPPASVDDGPAPGPTAPKSPTPPAKDPSKTPAPSTPGDKQPPDPDQDEPYVYPDVIHTGFTGADVFKVPVSSNLVGADLKWESADPSIVTIEPTKKPAEYDDPSWAMVTTKKAGKTSIKVSAGGKTLNVEVNVMAYTAEQIAAGKTRYKTGGAGPTQVACASCHEKPDGADHSPTILAEYDDADIVSAITTAVYASDGYELSLKTHKWELAEPEKVGIMAYLRALPPRGF